jgi:ABC-type Fe3+/spermidine/putrescine transport system ATPase subunit
MSSQQGSTSLTPAHAVAATPVSEVAGAEVDIRNIVHGFDSVIALRGVSLHVQGGDFFTLLGPSGSGKTTLLRIIAGLLEPSHGTIAIAGRDVTALPTQSRDIGFVFQNYALFPHLNVWQNIEFPLKLRHVAKNERRRRVSEMLDLISLHGYEKRHPSQLSGGQQQRVALARALAHGPGVLLLDEPLGALDRRLRQQLGNDLRRIQREAGATAIYVTHDQEEAFTLSDRVAVVHDGRVHQEGTPAELYSSPADVFVAGFVGETNLLEGKVVDLGEDVVHVRVDDSLFECIKRHDLRIGSIATCMLRPEQVLLKRRSDRRVRPEGNGTMSELGEARVEDVTFIGGRYRVVARWNGAALLAHVPIGDVPSVGDLVDLACAKRAFVAVDHIQPLSADGKEKEDAE